MSYLKQIKDSFLAGIFAGTVCLTVFYLLLNYFRLLLIDHYGNPYILRPPAVHLFSMILNLLVFRLVLINLGKEKTGKGILFITTLGTLVYFFIFYRYNH